MVSCPAYPDEFIRDNVIAPFTQLFVVILPALVAETT